MSAPNVKPIKFLKLSNKGCKIDKKYEDSRRGDFSI